VDSTLTPDSSAIFYRQSGVAAQSRVLGSNVFSVCTTDAWTLIWGQKNDRCSVQDDNSLSGCNSDSPGFRSGGINYPRLARALKRRGAESLMGGVRRHSSNAGQARAERLGRSDESRDATRVMLQAVKTIRFWDVVNLAKICGPIYFWSATSGEVHAQRLVFHRHIGDISGNLEFLYNGPGPGRWEVRGAAIDPNRIPRLCPLDSVVPRTPGQK
jgi:hypothetical protein